MSLFDTFDPHSEELIKVNQQRSFQETENFPDVVMWDPRTLGARPSSSHEKYLRVALEIAARL